MSQEKCKSAENIQSEPSTKMDQNEKANSSDANPDTATEQVKTTDSSLDKSAAAVYQGNGMAFRAKLIGQCQVNQSRGDPVCEVAMSLLKMKQLATRQHKKRISIQLQWDNMRISEEKTNEEIHTHALSKISYVWKDGSDPRAFGLIVSLPDESESNEFSFIFYAYKTEKAAVTVMLAMKELFTLRQKETKTQPDDKKEADKQLENTEEKTENVPEESLIDLDVEKATENPPITANLDETKQISDILRDPWSGEVAHSSTEASSISQFDLLQSVFTSASQPQEAQNLLFAPTQTTSQWSYMPPQINQVTQTNKTVPLMAFTNVNSSMTSSASYSMGPIAPFKNPHSALAGQSLQVQSAQNQLSTGTLQFPTGQTAMPMPTPYYSPSGPAFVSSFPIAQTAFSPIPQTNPFSNTMSLTKPLNPTNPFQNAVNSSPALKAPAIKDPKHDDLFADLLSSDLATLSIRENNQNKNPNQTDPSGKMPLSHPTPQTGVDWSMFEKSGNLLD